MNNSSFECCATQRDQMEMLQLESERQQKQKLLDQDKRRKQLDRSLRLKMKRQAREKQEELALDMTILDQLLAEEKDEKQEGVLKKVCLVGLGR